MIEIPQGEVEVFWESQALRDKIKEPLKRMTVVACRYYLLCKEKDEEIKRLTEMLNGKPIR